MAATSRDVLTGVLQSLWLFDPLQEFFVSAFTSNQAEVKPIYASISFSVDKPELPAIPMPLNGRVRFDPNTRVYEIPSHRDYSLDEHKRIWTSTADVICNAQRNRREFSSEHWDWQQVKEESEMFFDKSAQEFIHPVHLGGVKGLI